MSNFKFAVRCAVAGAIAAAAATSAYALPVSSYDNTFVNVYLSGSTAIDGTLTNAAIQKASGQIGVCQAGTIDIYTDSAKTEKLILCSASSASGLTAGTNLAIFKESQVGSANGVQPLINAALGTATTLNFFVPSLMVADSACNTAGSPVAAVGTDLGAYTSHTTCTAASIQTAGAAIPTGGFSDVEAAILKTPLGAPVSATVANANLAATPTLDQLWGVPVTQALYYDLQAAQFGATSACATTGKDTAACAPSLTKSQVSGLYTQAIQTAGALGLTNAAGDAQVYMCRRDDGSGTEASYEYLFTGERCGKTSSSVPAEDGGTVWAQPSGGSVRNCLAAFQSGGTVTSYYGNGTLAATGGQYAVGMLSMEVTAAQLVGFRFVKVDGALPTIANVQNGYYPYFSSGAAYVVKSGKTNAPTGAPLAVVTAINHLLGHPVWTADSNVGYSANYYGVSGDLPPSYLYAATLPPTLPATSSAAATMPTNAWTKAASGSVNNCDIPQWDSHLPSAKHVPITAPINN